MLHSRRCRPENHVLDYIISLRNEDLKRRTNWPPLDYPKMGRERARRELLIAEEALKKKREKTIASRVDFAKKWKEIEEEGTTLKQNFIHFNEFLLVNLAKRERAADLIKDNIKLREKYEESIRDLHEKIVEMKKSKKSLDLEIRKHNIYERYLNNVVELPGEWEGIRNVNDLVKRFEYYNELRQQLVKQSTDAFNRLQNARMEMGKFIENGKLAIIGLLTQIANLQDRYENVTKKTFELENLVFQIKTHIMNRLSDIDVVKNATWNLFRMACKRTGAVLKVRKEDVDKQLVHIKRMLAQFRMINEALYAKPNKHKSKKKVNNQN